MLPEVDALFTLVRQLAGRLPVSEVAASKWLVQRHGLAAMAARAGAVSYRDDLVRATVEWARIEQDLPPIVEALDAAGISVAPIKGVAYATSLYSTPAERPMGDVDLLVPPDRREDAARVLQKLGFARGPSLVLHHAEAWTRGDFAIDLHSNIIAMGRARIDLAGLWSRTTAGWPTGARRLEANDALLFHLIHLARNRLRLPLMNVVDAARLLERADRGVVLCRAREWGLRRATERALAFCTAILEGHELDAGGWFGPRPKEIAQIAEPSAARKILFDAAIAGSLTQLSARTLAFVLNKVRPRNR